MVARYPNVIMAMYNIKIKVVTSPPMNYLYGWSCRLMLSYLLIDSTIAVNMTLLYNAE